MTLEAVIGTHDMEIPNSDLPFYVATKKGWIVTTPTLFGQAHTLTKEHPSSLPELKEEFILNDFLMPVHMLTQFHDFARQNWELNKAECSAYLTFNDATEVWRLFIPEQYVSHTSVNHKLDVGQIRDGFRAVGTIHSHCDFGAFHSGTDKHDMGKMPGLHITIGHVDNAEPEYAFALSVGDAAFTVEQEQIIDPERFFDANGYATAPEWWLNFVHVGTAPWGYNGGVKTTYNTHKPPTQVYGKKYTPGEWRSKTGYDYSDYDYGWPSLTQQPLWESKEHNKDAFTSNSVAIEASEEILEMEAIHLALQGFNLAFSISHNPKRAEQFLKTQGIQVKSDEDVPLLPEVI